MVFSMVTVSFGIVAVLLCTVFRFLIYCFATAGNLASKFAASELYTELLSHLPDLMRINEKKSSISSNNELPWKEEIRVNVTKAFESVHGRFLDRITMMTSAISEVGSAPKMDQSGTTATALLVTDEVVIAAVLGDSRGVIAATNNSRSSASIDSNGKNKWKSFPEVSPIQLSIDHVASDPTEKQLVLQRGGTVSESGDIARVNGTLAITRSIGDESLSPVLSREPHVRIFDRTELRELCGNLNSGETVIPCFAILGKLNVDVSFKVASSPLVCSNFSQIYTILNFQQVMVCGMS